MGQKQCLVPPPFMPMLPRPALGGDTIAKGLAHPALLRTVDTSLLLSSANTGCPACHLSAPCFFFFFKAKCCGLGAHAVGGFPEPAFGISGHKAQARCLPWQRHGMAQCFPLGLVCARHGRGACPWHQWGTRHGMVLAPGITGHKAQQSACPSALMGTRHGRVLAPVGDGNRAQQGACPWQQWGTRHGRVLAPGITGHKARQSACPCR